MAYRMNKRPYIIGVAGTSGSGKTLFLQYLLKQFAPGDMTLISLDDYYRPVTTRTREENMCHNFDIPEAFDLETFHTHVRQLRSSIHTPTPCSFICRSPYRSAGTVTVCVSLAVLVSATWLTVTGGWRRWRRDHAGTA